MLSTDPPEEYHLPEKAGSDMFWSSNRPAVLVVCCSDGRFQKTIDEFLVHHLNISFYDRLYMPGGPGALATSSGEFLRADEHRKDLTFLIKVHSVHRMILVFHGPSPSGPEEAVCAHYRRIMPGRSPADIDTRQVEDLSEIHRLFKRNEPDLHIQAFRAVVAPTLRVSFIDMLGEPRRTFVQPALKSTVPKIGGRPMKERL